MRIKKFTGATLQEVTGQMKAELGAEAVILNTRKVHKGGLLNFVGKEMYEITAAIDAEGEATANTYAQVLAGAQTSTGSQAPAVARPPRQRVASNEMPMAEIAQVAREFEKRKQRNSNAPATKRALQDAGDLQELRSEVEDIKVAIREIANHFKYANMPALPDHLKRAYTTLVGQDVEEQLAADIVQSAYAKLGENAIDDEAAVDKFVIDVLASQIRTVSEAAARNRQTNVVCLVGPTGVGKTTSIAKLAARRKLIDGLSVALISADTYRIGAIEQLQTFAAIADMPLEVVYTPDDMSQALQRFREKDVVYVDTVGRNQYRNEEVNEVAAFVTAAQADEVHLVLGASTQTRTLLESAERFKVVKPNRLLMTKTDEAAATGALLTLVRQSGLPISYVTTGQSVPDDIVVARASDLAVMMYKGVLPHA
jgi:flagellar biosynthesis protein FlhF